MLGCCRTEHLAFLKTGKLLPCFLVCQQVQESFRAFLLIFFRLKHCEPNAACRLCFPCFVTVNQRAFKQLPAYCFKRELYLFGIAADDIFNRNGGRRYIKYVAYYFVDSVNADRTYRIKGNNKRLQVFSVLYVCFYIFRKASWLGFTAKRAYFDTEIFMSGDITPTVASITFRVSLTQAFAAHLSQYGQEAQSACIICSNNVVPIPVPTL